MSLDTNMLISYAALPAGNLIIWNGNKSAIYLFIFLHTT